MIFLSKWYRLDNAAKIFPPSRSKNDYKVFRFSVTLLEPVKVDILNKALDIQPNNLDVMYNLIQAYKENEDKTSDNYLELARQVVENFKYYPLAMVDLLAQIQSNIDETQLPLFDL